MSNTASPADRTASRDRIIIILALLATIAMLCAILFMLVSISRNGLNIRLGGDLSFGELADPITVQLTMDESVALTLAQPIQMVAAGPNGDPIPATLSLALCPTCGGAMLPSKWNLWDGHIEWTCPTCDLTSGPSRAP